MHTASPSLSVTSFIASAIPGRLRLRHAELRKAGRLAKLEQHLAGWPQVREIRLNHAAGSLLIHYDANALSEAECRKRCEAALTELLPWVVSTNPTNTPIASVAAAQKPRSTLTRVRRANQMAKRGMLVSLTASMILSAVGPKKWHIWTGIAFLHALGVHLWVHRHSLLK